MSNLEYKVIVGLEIHVQLCTKTKMFCGCKLEFGAEPNSRVCPVCLGMPGSLPVMNATAFEYAVMAALSLNCEIAEFTKWDRKSYYYPDLPKNYQISQYDMPFSSNGYIEIPVADAASKKIRILRAHLEEDAGKNVHTAGNFSQVDLNRAGTPLLEIVTEPDMNSPEEVKALAVQLQRIVRYLGISEASMQKGHMRFEPNINLHITKDGQKFKTPITEVKNLNSFKALEKSVAYETQRQLDQFLTTSVTLQTGNKTTRGWDADNEVTVLQREKEEAHDYRYFPDPDLVPVKLTPQWIEDTKAKLCELPLQKQMRYVQQYKLSDYDASVLTADRSTAEFFDSIVKAGAEPKRACNLICQRGLQLANEAGCLIDQLGISAEAMAELANLIDSDQINASAADVIIEKMAGTNDPPLDIAKKLNLIQKSDADELGKIVDQIFQQNPKAVEDAKQGKKAKASRGFLVGQVMKMTKGQANPGIVAKIIAEKLR